MFPTEQVYYSRMTYDDLLAQNERLQAENAALRPCAAELEHTVAALEAALREALAQLEATLRAGRRQAAPPSRGQPKANSNPHFTRRDTRLPSAPGPSGWTGWWGVNLNHTTCPACGGDAIQPGSTPLP